MAAEQPGASALAADQLHRPSDLSALVFETTAALEPLGAFAGQQRALEAIRFGAAIDKDGFNLFAVGRIEAGLREALAAGLEPAARGRPAPPDWVYVNNFADPRRPTAIALSAGQAPRFQTAMRGLIEDLKAAIPSVFASEDYQAQRGAIDENARKAQGEALGGLQQKAAEKSITVVRTPMGFTLVPVRNGQIVPPEEFNGWSEAQRQQTQADIEVLEKDLERIVHQAPQLEKNRRELLRQLNRQTAEAAVGHLIEERKQDFADNAAIAAHLDGVRADLIDNIVMFAALGEGEGMPDDGAPGGPFDRYEVNVAVTRAQAGAPIVEEPHPTLAKLIGSVEHAFRQGALISNFRLIKAGAIHQANGGFLLIDARALLSEPFSWPALKRALTSRAIAIEDVGQLVGLSSTVSLEPDPIPLEVKVVLFGDRGLYYLLSALDPELGQHFKVLADFDDDIDRSAENEAVLARLIATLAAGAGLNALDREAVGRVIEHVARLTGDSGKLSVLSGQIRDVLVEADFRARDAGRPVIARADVERALDEQVRRAARIRDRVQESIIQRIALIETDGARIGQINGLSVSEIGGFMFGRPTRISCQVRPGAGRLIDIEREVELGGPLHSKGVLILSGYLMGRYALDTPMSLYASLVFEQSYGGVDGDSASSAELYALLSALAQVPLRQDLAVTGSVNQHGEVQAIGGVNEKIEGFFDICAARGLTGRQGVVIPRANVRHLMLRADVVEACAAGRFAVHAVSTIDEGVALMTAREAGTRGADGRYGEASVNRLVEDRLRAFADVRRSFAENGKSDASETPR